MKARIGICLGDVTGIGPEVTLKALAAERDFSDFRFLLIGDAGHIQRANERLRLNLPIGGGATQNTGDRFVILQPEGPALADNLKAGAPEAARATLSWLREGARQCLAGELEAMVTAPVNKEAIIRSGERFVGQTELLSELAGAKRTAMMLLGEDDRGRWLRVALATTHLPLKDVSAQLNDRNIQTAIELAAEACQQLGLSRAKIGVCGLNPHGGEGGQMGDEEIRVIGPAVGASQKKGLDVHGPVSADALFYHAYRGEYDAVVAMYHDQGLVPLKMIGFDRGVNWTLGLPFIRTSPDHGTAYDIAGKGVANPSSMMAAIQLAKKLVSGRRKSD